MHIFLAKSLMEALARVTNPRHSGQTCATLVKLRHAGQTRAAGQTSAIQEANRFRAEA